VETSNPGACRIVDYVEPGVALWKSWYRLVMPLINTPALVSETKMFDRTSELTGLGEPRR